MTLSKSSLLSQLQWPEPGTIVSVSLGFGFRHRGVVSDKWEKGIPMIISNSRKAGGVTESTWETFGCLEHWRVDETSGPAAGLRAVQRARSQISTQYDLVNWNCDHLVYYSVGLPPQSPQILISATIAAALMLLRFSR
jgi:hypothetical protein